MQLRLVQEVVAQEVEVLVAAEVDMVQLAAEVEMQTVEWQMEQRMETILRWVLAVEIQIVMVVLVEVQLRSQQVWWI